GPDRVTPKCAHFGTCGGCKWQHTDYEAQLRYKASQVKENLEKIGKLDLPEILPIRGSDPVFYYRNRLDFGFSHQRYLLPEEMDGETQKPLEGLGLHVPGRFDKILDIETCYLQDDFSNNIRRFSKALAQEMELPFYDLKNHT